MNTINKRIFELTSGSVSIIFYLLIKFFISHKGESDSFLGVFLSILNALYLLISIPLLILYSYMGFALDVIFSTGVGYESLQEFRLGILFMEITNVLYFFIIGVALAYLCRMVLKLVQSKKHS